ncbi:hypothetical protein [Schlesneria paludicola]|uniref:hypothetical protein n=1 Tax=Schlesneria paludicola TaxID=360056 RepID=UPI00029A8616|nr:hypothetical protein [Schlesneria paludicola]
MGFTLQRLSNNDPVTNRTQWAVVLDREHVMFVGDYQQCEEWLDYHELLETTFDSQSPKPPVDQGTKAFRRFRRLVQAIADWCQSQRLRLAMEDDSSLRSTSAEPPQKPQLQGFTSLVAFASDESGHAGVGESVAATLLVGLLWIGTTLITLVVPWTVAAHCSSLLKTDDPGRANFTRAVRSQPVYQTDSIDIVCDLATTDH